MDGAWDRITIVELQFVKHIRVMLTLSRKRLFWATGYHQICIEY